MYADRVDAGQQLAKTLADRRDPKLVVLGLPRGGVVVAAEIARALDAELDVVLCKKLRTPDNPELALGAISEGGQMVLNAEVFDYLEIGKTYLEHEKRQRLDEMEEQIIAYRRVRPRIPLGGRPVIVVDDGLATGSTMIAAVQATAANHPRSLVVAVPGGAADTANKIRLLREVDEVVCLETPSLFYGVGQLYDNFDQVEDEEVIRLLKTQPTSRSA